MDILMKTDMQKATEHMPTVTVSSWGNSEGIRLPKSLREQAGIGAGSLLDAAVVDGSIVLTPLQEQSRSVGQYTVPTIQALFADYEGSFTSQEWDTGAPAGLESI
ncbi:hypothetical protein KIM372_17060 [Bombiscardovia nodaiensis]|uniref:SpoVT-AbrB domain-containing protein n=1 Tax=Bombiscardovia nodaiensis TaxID=2932181 RepID=A0ABM8BA57_9BIFI|nr:hypothetical protein KIM372_17060 [Bombiscardovia nodaiensis]